MKLLFLELLIILGLLASSLWVRVGPLYEVVYSGEEPRVASVDGDVFVRAAEVLSVNWPNYSEYDPYRNYPNSGFVNNSDIPYIYLLAGISLLFNISVETVGIWIPVLFGLFSIIIMYFISRSLFGKWVALISLVLISVLPGSFLSRTSLGEADRHCFEIFLSTLVMLFFLISLKIKNYKFKIIVLIIAGVVLGIYLLSWAGSLLFVFIIMVAIFAKWLIGLIKKTNIDKSLYLESAILLMSSLVVVIIHGESVSMLLIVLILSIISTLALYFFEIKLSKVYGILFGTIFLLITMVAVFIFSPNIYYLLNAIFMWRGGSGTGEEFPLLIDQGLLSFMVSWNYFTGVFFLFLISVGMFVYLIKRNVKYSSILILASWGIVLLIATLSMRRFAYYLSIPMCIMAAYFIFMFLKRISVKLNVVNWNRFVIISLLFLSITFVPSLMLSAGASRAHTINKVTTNWMESLLWIKNNTSDPIPGGYYSVYGDNYIVPVSAYGILAWSDYGYWITMYGERMSYSDTTGGDNLSFNEIMCGSLPDELLKKLNVKYIIIDNLTVRRIQGINKTSVSLVELLYTGRSDRLKLVFSSTGSEEYINGQLSTVVKVFELR